MREIKFRVWDSGKKRMLPIQRHSFKTGKSMPYGWNMEYVFDDLMQYTGLKDKNGKEIYEGDIIQFYNDVDYILKPSYAEVIFEDGSFCAKHFKYGTEHLANLDVSDMDITVAGNIYQDKHLLGEV